MNSILHAVCTTCQLPGGNGIILSRMVLGMNERVGQQLGNYRLTYLLGRGGFADVYLGEHIYLGTQAAIKVLAAEMAANEMESFLKEARNLSHLVHPHIIRVLEFGIEGHTPFLVMDYAPNGTLRHLHPAGTVVPLPTVVSYVKQVAEALQYAHEQKLIHRDIKPENLLVGRNHEILLTDFGIAVIRKNTGSMSFQRMMGTVAYMAPEQMHGRPRPASDQYSLAIVVYEWLCGERPFNGSLTEIFSQHLFVPPPSLHEKNAALPLAVEQVVFKALAKEPHDRFVDVRTFALELEQATLSALPLLPTIDVPVRVRPAEPQLTPDLVKARFQHIPARLTPLIGREQEERAVSAMLLRPEVRLLTLTGTGGIGKTSLSLQVATDLLDVFPDGVCFVALASISDPELVVCTIAQALGIREAREAGYQPLFERLKVFLRDRQLLLLLDNFEQVLAAAPRVSELLLACPQLKILVTSRAALRVQGEYEFSVPPLALPNLKQLPDRENLSHYAAVALFVERAQASRADFQVTTANAEVVAEICTRLDGLPLALELAAARIKLLTPQALLTRLEHRLQVLTSGGRDVPSRQQTLRNTIAWSYALLDGEEQKLFRRLSVFVGGCTLEAAEAVCNAPNDMQTFILDGVASLIDKSLLQQIEQGDEEPRLRLLETIREYGLECLVESGEMEAMQRAHAEYYLALVEEAEPELRGPKQVLWLDRLEREYDNLRAAQQWLLERKETELALRLGGGQWWFWMVRGHVGEARNFLERALTTNDQVQASVRGKALYAAGVMALNQNDYDRAQSLYEESLSLHRQLGDKASTAISLYSLGQVAWAKHNYAEAQRLGEEALALFRELGDKWGTAYTLEGLAAVAFFQNEYDSARSQLEESLALFRELGNKWGMAYALLRLARVMLRLGEQGKASALLEESLTLGRELRYKWGMAYVLFLLGQLALQEGDTAKARALLEEGLAINREMGDRRRIVRSLLQLASVAVLQGDSTAARALYQESLSLARALNHQELVASALAGLSNLEPEKSNSPSS